MTSVFQFVGHTHFLALSSLIMLVNSISSCYAKEERRDQKHARMRVVCITLMSCRSTGSICHSLSCCVITTVLNVGEKNQGLTKYSGSFSWYCTIFARLEVGIKLCYTLQFSYNSQTQSFVIFFIPINFVSIAINGILHTRMKKILRTFCATHYRD